MLKLRDPLSERVHLGKGELLAFTLAAVAGRDRAARGRPASRLQLGRRRMTLEADRQPRSRHDCVRQLVLCRDAHPARRAAAGDVPDLQLLPQGRRHRRFRRAAATNGSQRCSNGATTSTRSIAASRRRGSPTMSARSSASTCSAPTSSPSSTAWKWTCRRTSARPTSRRSISIATGWRARSAACPCACSACPRATASQLAHHLGRALQLTNILRDIDEDAGLGRLYLPREWLHEAGITETDPLEVAVDPRLPKVCAPLVERARMHFAKSDEIMARNPRRVVRAPRIMSKYYRLDPATPDRARICAAARSRPRE